MMSFANEENEAFVHLRTLFKNLSYTRRPTQRYERHCQPTEHPEWDSYVRILTPSAQESWKDYTVFKTVTWIGKWADELPGGWFFRNLVGQTS